LRADRFLLFQALSNLIQHAIDFSPVDASIKLTGRVEVHNLKFMVEDHRAGIPDFALEKVFHKFFSLQRPHSGKKSTGLGLNIVKEMAVLHQRRRQIGKSSGRGRPRHVGSSHHCRNL
jgi:two-component system, OmpR family, sensor histidine kinase CreC